MDEHGFLIQWKWKDPAIHKAAKWRERFRDYDYSKEEEEIERKKREKDHTSPNSFS